MLRYPVAPKPPSPSASPAAADALLNPVPLGDRATHGWTQPDPLSTPVASSPETVACGTGKPPSTPPPAPALFEREVGDEPDRWAPRVGDPKGRARRISGHGFFGSRLPEAKAYSRRAPSTSSLSPRAVVRLGQAQCAAPLCLA